MQAYFRFMKILILYITLLLLRFSVSYAQQLQPGDLVINEVLFNPVKDGFDYVEGYNRANKTIDLQELVIANRDSPGDIAGQRAVTRGTMLIAPGEYFVITANEKWLRQHYIIPASAVVCQINTMPSFPNDGGHVLFLDKNDTVIDELNYSEKWHFMMISDPEGVSLERINYDSPTQDKNNWTSASSSSGYGTPGFQNSHFRASARAEEEFFVSPKVFSPDNDGINDFGLIDYNMKESGYIANLIIYDIAGRKVRYLIKNENLGLTNKFRWDGLDEQSNPLPPGIYILYSKIHNLEGQTKKFKRTIILQRKIN